MSEIKLGIIGGGQLGSMLSDAAKKLNIKTVIYCDDVDAPAKNFCDEFIFGKYDEKEKINEFIEKIDIATYEFENIPFETLNEINKSRSMPFSRFLSALGIPGIGPELATSMSYHFQTPERLFEWIGKTLIDDAEMREITSIDGVGDIVALQLRDGMLHRKDAILDLLTHLSLEKDVRIAGGGPFEGMTFCVTGTLSESRKNIQARIKSAGGKVVGSVSGNLSVLVAGANAGSKLAKAEKLNLTVWNEETLLQRISERSNVNERKPPTSQSTLFDY